MAVLVAIYTRVSREDTEEPQSTRRQERACREYARSRNWEVVNVFEDVDVSAYVRGVRRPAFQDLLRLVSGARVNGVVVWKLDRLVRRASDFEKFWDRCDSAGVFLTSVTEPIDSTTQLGLAVIRILVNFANVESTSIGLRQSAKLQEKARAGAPLWPLRLFGFNQDATALIDDEAALIREAAHSVLDGVTLDAIARNWTERGIVTPQGRTNWSRKRLADMLSHPRLIGHNRFKGEIVARDCFPAILDPLTHARLGAILANRSRLGSCQRSLLSGLLRCGGCGKSMVIGSRPNRLESATGRHRFYRCDSTSGGCGRVRVDARFVEALVVEGVLSRIESRRRREPATLLPEDASEELAEAYARYATALSELASDYYVHRRLTREEWSTAREGIEQQLSTARRALDPGWRASVVVRDGRPVPFRKEWESYDIAHRRDIVASELDHALVQRHSAGEQLRADLVQPFWVGSPSSNGPQSWSVSVKAVVTNWPYPGWLPLRQAAAILRTNRQWVMYHVEAGHLSAHKVGARHWFDPAEVKRFSDLVSDTVGVPEVASLMGVDKSTLVAWIKRGQVPANKVGHLYHIRRSDLAEWGRQLEQLVRPVEAARLLGVSSTWVYERMRRGELTWLSTGWATRHVDRRDVERMLDARRAKMAPPDAVSITAASKRLRCGKRTLQHLILKGKLPAFQISNGWYMLSTEQLDIAANLLLEANPRRSKPTGSQRGRRAPAA